MTTQEYKDLFDAIYYGHDAEICIHGQRYFLEWDNNEICIFQILNSDGNKIAIINGKEKLEITQKLFDFPFGQTTLNSSYVDFEIIDIE